VGAHPFDEVAPAYADGWGAHPLARALRARVIATCAEFFPEGGRVADLGCGPGLDASVLLALGYRVVAADASPGMVAEARARGVDARVGDLADPPVEGPLDGALSDFGALNCLPSLAPFGAALADRLAPGAHAVLVVMGRHCVAESLALLARGRRPRRRDGPMAMGSRTVTVRYLTAGQVRDEIGPAFVLARVEALGALVAPPDLGGRVGRRARLEPFVARLPLLREAGDHTLLVFRRR
jgi:SAM-dependent methyltransferase